MADAKDAKTTGKESPMGFLIGMVLVSVISGASGWVFFSQVLQTEPAANAKPQKNDKSAEKKEGAHGEASKDKHEDEDGAAGAEIEIVPLTPIVTNLAKPSGTFVRLEGSLVVEKETADIKVLVPKVSEDIIALLRSLTLSELQGANGLSHLRDDINDRVRIRSEGKARELIISTLVIE